MLHVYLSPHWTFNVFLLWVTIFPHHLALFEHPLLENGLLLVVIFLIYYSLQLIYLNHFLLLFCGVTLVTSLTVYSFQSNFFLGGPKSCPSQCDCQPPASAPLISFSLWNCSMIHCRISAFGGLGQFLYTHLPAWKEVALELTHTDPIVFSAHVSYVFSTCH